MKNEIKNVALEGDEILLLLNDEDLPPKLMNIFDNVLDEAREELSNKTGLLFDPFIVKYPVEIDENELKRVQENISANIHLKKYEQAKQVVKEFENNYILKLKDTSKLWKYLFHHAQLVKIYADVYIARFNGNEDECKAKAQEIYDYANSIRTFTDTVLDDNFLRGDVYNNLFGWRKTI